MLNLSQKLPDQSNQLLLTWFVAVFRAHFPYHSLQLFAFFLTMKLHWHQLAYAQSPRDWWYRSPLWDHRASRAFELLLRKKLAAEYKCSIFAVVSSSYIHHEKRYFTRKISWQDEKQNIRWKQRKKKSLQFVVLPKSPPSFVLYCRFSSSGNQFRTDELSCPPQYPWGVTDSLSDAFQKEASHTEFYPIIPLVFCRIQLPHWLNTWTPCMRSAIVSAGPT